MFNNPSLFQVNGFRSYVDLYVKDKLDETGVALKVVHETVNDRWEVCLTMSEKGFQQISFVNSIATTKVSAYEYRLQKCKWQSEVKKVRLTLTLVRFRVAGTLTMWWTRS